MPVRETPLYRLAILCGADVRRDRGDALYVTRGISEAGVFRAEPRGDGLTALYLTDGCLPALDAWLPPFSKDGLYVSLLRLKGKRLSAGEASLLTKCVKLFEMNAPFPARIEREIRQMCALSLRTGTGGGALYLARAMMLMGG